MNKKFEMLANILLLLFALLITFAVGEVLARIFLGTNLHYTYTNDATMWELEPNQKGVSLPGGPEATINSGGFRGYEISEEKPKGTVRIALLGGSIGFGWGVADNETLASQLEKKFKNDGLNVQVLNLGEAGYGVSQMIAKYHKIGTKYDPDIVIVLFAMSNVLAQPDINGRQRTRSMLARKLLRASSLAAYLKPRLEFMRHFITGLSKNETSFKEPWDEDSQRILALNKELKNKGKILVLLPYVQEDRHAGFYAAVKKFGLKNNIEVTNPIYEAIDAYKKTHDKAVLRVSDGHPSALQFRIVADIIYPTLKPLVVSVLNESG